MLIAIYYNIQIKYIPIYEKIKIRIRYHPNVTLTNCSFQNPKSCIFWKFPFVIHLCFFDYFLLLSMFLMSMSINNLTIENISLLRHDGRIFAFWQKSWIVTKILVYCMLHLLLYLQTIYHHNDHHGVTQLVVCDICGWSDSS